MGRATRWVEPGSALTEAPARLRPWTSPDRDGASRPVQSCKKTTASFPWGLRDSTRFPQRKFSRTQRRSHRMPYHRPMQTEQLAPPTRAIPHFAVIHPERRPMVKIIFLEIGTRRKGEITAWMSAARIVKMPRRLIERQPEGPPGDQKHRAITRRSAPPQRGHED